VVRLLEDKRDDWANRSLASAKVLTMDEGGKAKIRPARPAPTLDAAGGVATFAGGLGGLAFAQPLTRTRSICSAGVDSSR